MQDKNKSYQPLIEPKLTWHKKEEQLGEFSIQPLESGFGLTLGNALRRVMLSFIEGSAVTSLIIEGANNEFSVLPGVVEDLLQVISNIKKLVIKNSSGKPGTLRVNKKGLGSVFASDIECDAHLEILNKDALIATLSSNGIFNVEMFVEVGRGYTFARWPGNIKVHTDGRIYIDALFSPVLSVAYNVDKTRVDDVIDYDKLIMNIVTNGAINPVDALEYASSVLRTNFKFFMPSSEDIDFGFKSDSSSAEEEGAGFYSTIKLTGGSHSVPVELFTKSIEELELSVRAQNCLESSEIKTILDLVNLSEEEALKIKNFGRKTLKEVKEVLSNFGLKLGMNIKMHDLKKARKENSSLDINRF